MHDVGQWDEREFIVEYAAHPQAQLHIKGAGIIEQKDLKKKKTIKNISIIPPAEQLVHIHISSVE